MNTTSCPRLALLSRAHAEGLVEPMSTHVETCARCASVLQGLSRLRELARELPYEEPPRERLREVGRALLAQAEVVQPPQRRWLPVGAAALVGAMAASVAVYLAIGGSEASPPAVTLAEISAAPGSIYEHLTHHPSAAGEALAEVVRLSSGSLQLHVQHLAPHERFLVRTADAEVEVRGTRFSVIATDDRLQHVDVTEGKVEVRALGREPLLLLPGDRWDRGQAAAAQVGSPAAAPAGAQGPGVAGAASPLLAAPAPRASAPARKVASAPRREPAVAVATPAPTPAPPEEPAPPAAPPQPRPAEAAFAAGWDLLRSGQADPAAARLAEVPDGDELGAEAAYWRIVALAQGGREDAAVAAMRTYLERHGGAPRAGEVALMLGLRLADRGELEGAIRELERAAADDAPLARDPARRALEAIRARMR